MQKLNKLYFSLIFGLIIAIFCNVFFCGNLIVNAEEEKTDQEEIEVAIPDPWDGLTYERFDEAGNGSGTVDDPYIIDTAGKLAYIAQTVNYTSVYYGVYFKQTADINLGAVYNYETKSITGTMWNSIGYYNSDTEYRAFRGHYDGGGYRIFNVGYTSTSRYNKSYGLFGYTDGATISNVNLSISVKLDTGYNGVGGLVGRANNTNITNCDVNFNSTGNTSNVGPLVGVYNSDTLTNVSNNRTNGYITATSSASNISGLIAVVNNFANDSELNLNSNSSFTSIDAYNLIGGICSMTSGVVNITNCINYGTIDANTCSNVGGIIGIATNKITNCSNYGNITSNGTNIGGIAGQSTGEIINCVNYATITGNDYVAGIVGATKAVVRDCINKGSITGNNYVAGIVASVNSNSAGYIFEKNYNASKVTGNTYVAGVVAHLKNVDMRLCFSVGASTNTTENPIDIEGVNFVAGLVAYVDNANIDTCYSTANIKSGDIGAGLVARYAGPAGSNTFDKFYYIGSVTGKSIAGIVQNSAYVTLSNGYSVVNLVAIDNDTPIDFAVSGAVVGTSTESGYSKICYNTDECSTPSGTMVAGLIAVTTDQLIRDELEVFSVMDYYILPEEEVYRDYYYDYYPLLRDLHFNIYNSEYDNYFINYSEVSAVVKNSAVARVFDTVHITFETNCDIVADEVMCRQNVDITDLMPGVSKEGYIFRGWYLDSDFAVKADLTKGLATSATLYARFDYPETSFPWWIFIVIIGVAVLALAGVLVFVFRRKTISFRVEGLEIPDIKIRVGTFIKLPKPKKTGYRFKGWYYNEELTKKFDLELMPNINLILYGTFKKIERRAKSGLEKAEEKKPVKRTRKSTKDNKDTPNILKESESKSAVDTKKTDEVSNDTQKTEDVISKDITDAETDNEKEQK